MRIGYIFLLARRFLFKKRGSTITATMAVTATILIIITNNIIFGGLVNGLAVDIADFRYGHVQVKKDKGFIDTPDYQIIGQIMRNPEVLGAAPRVIGPSNINYTSANGINSIYSVETVGIDPTAENQASLLKDAIISGNFAVYQNSIVLGKEAAEDLGVEVGKYVTVEISKTKRSLQVVGIMETSLPAGFNKSAIIHIRTMREMLNLGSSENSIIIVRLKNPSEANSVSDWIQSKFPKLKVETVNEVAKDYIQNAMMIASYINLVGFAGMLASSLGVITILTMMVTGKTREIGVLRALGIQKESIIGIFIVDGAIIGALGAFIGGVVGASMMLYFMYNPVAPMGGLVLRITPSITSIIFPALAGLAMSVIASLYPAWRASRYEPAEAMRYF